jgi:hypothetical protein
MKANILSYARKFLADKTEIVESLRYGFAYDNSTLLFCNGHIALSVKHNYGHSVSNFSVVKKDKTWTIQPLDEYLLNSLHSFDPVYDILFDVRNETYCTVNNSDVIPITLSMDCKSYKCVQIGDTIIDQKYYNILDKLPGREPVFYLYNFKLLKSRSVKVVRVQSDYAIAIAMSINPKGAEISVRTS